MKDLIEQVLDVEAKAGAVVADAEAARAEREKRIGDARLQSNQLADVSPDAQRKAVDMIVAAVLGRTG
jgi:hypothetical protein